MFANLSDITDKFSKIDEDALLEVSDELWDIGSIEQIKSEVSDEVFTVFIGSNLIGNWKADGWWFIFCEMVQLIPYASNTLKKLELNEIHGAFESVLACFPEGTKFVDNSDYTDIVNFLHTSRYKTKNEQLACISTDDRKKMMMNLRQNLELLEDITEPLWNEKERDGWGSIADYIEK